SGRLFAVVLVLDFLVVGIDDIVAGRLIRSRSALFGLLGLIDRLTELHGHFHERIGLGLDVVRIGLGGLDGGLEGGNGVLDGLAVGFRDLVAVFLQRLFRGVDQAFGLVLRLDALTALLVGLGIGLGILDHLLDIGVGKTAGGLDADLVLLAGALVLGRD